MRLLHSRTVPLAYAALLAVLVALSTGIPPYDDAFFFVRFARNFLDHGVFAWNVADGPVHGNTSQLFQGVVTGVAVVLPSHTVAGTRVLLAACLAVGAWILARATEAPPVYLAFASPVALATVTSGMETALVLALGAVFVALITRPDAVRTHPWSLAALVVVLYLARPDTGLLTVGSLIVAGPARSVARPVAVAAVGLVGALIGLKLYYGTALPLSFTLKSGLSELYDPAFLAKSRAAKTDHFALFAFTVAPLLFLAGRAWSRSWRLLVPAFAFVGYHVLFTVDVMGLHARFFAPALPWLAGAAAVAYQKRGRGVHPRSSPSGGEPHHQRYGHVSGPGLLALAALITAAYAFGFVPTDADWALRRISPITYGAYLLATAAVLTRYGTVPQRSLVALATIALGLVATADRSSPDLRSDRQHAKTYQHLVTSWNGLGRAHRCLGPDIQLYHSEIGVPGVLLPDATITDLGGLMNPEMLLDGAGFDEVCLRDRPEVIFLPHKNYVAHNAEVLASTCLKDYQRVVKKSSSPLYVRTDLLEQYDCP